MTPMIRMTEIRRLAHERNPGFANSWFDPGAMKFFGTTLPDYGYRTPHGVFFVTKDTEPDDVPRFTIRCLPNEGRRTIETVGEYRGFATQREATAKIPR